MEGAFKLAKKIATMSPSALRWTKVTLNASLDLDRHASLHYSDWCMSNLGVVTANDWKKRKAGRE
jgi:enoyl-CoA hydratase/carnithine racemase